jgi:GTP-binding protein EngB required for normal cell division
MNPKVTALEARKKISQAKVETRRIFLKEKGLSDEAIRKDVTIRKLKAEARKSDFRMAAIAKQEEITRRVAKAKADKLAAAKLPKEEPPEEKPAKKEKKGKKERSAESEAKIEKPENKTEQ